MTVTAETPLASAIEELIAANHILAMEGVLDAYGHVSIRHPQDPTRFLLSCSRSPELVGEKDIMEFGLDGESVRPDKRSPYLERFIHAAFYEKRPEIQAVVHSHAEDVLPFTVTKAPLRPVMHSAISMGKQAPVWDSEHEFGATNLLVANVAQGHSLAKRLDQNQVVLMRGHGFAAAGTTLFQVVATSVYLPKNARVLMNALRLGEVKYITDGEIEKRSRAEVSYPGQVPRAWEYWKSRAAAAERR